MNIKRVQYLLIGIFFLFSTQLDVKAQEHLIPLPIDMQFGEASLDLAKGIILQKNNSLLDNEYSLAQEILDDWQVNSVSGKAKLPVHDFTGRTWDNPIKWMFTFVPYR